MLTRLAISAAATLLAINPLEAKAECVSSAPERLELRIFRYSGVSSRNDDMFSLFHGIISEKLQQLAKEATNPNLNVKYLAGLRVSPQSSELDAFANPPGRADHLRVLWQYQRSYLLLLTGIFYQTKGADGVTNSFVTSSFYWGDLRPPSLPDSVQARLAVTPEGFEHARDSHSFITLAALAMDAKLRKCHSSIVLHFLQTASEKAKDLERDRQLSGDLQKLRDYIESEITLYLS